MNLVPTDFILLIIGGAVMGVFAHFVKESEAACITVFSDEPVFTRSS